MNEAAQDSGSAARVAILESDGSRRLADQYDAPLLTVNSGPVSFHVMAKPVGSTCNLDCTYCF